MASTGSWNVVGKGKKPKVSVPMTKSQKKQLEENMPRVEIFGTPLETSSIYDALVAKERQQEKHKFVDKIGSGKGSPGGRGIADSRKHANTNNKKKKPEPEKKKKSLDDAIKGVTEDDLQNVLVHSKELFPDKSEVWMKDLISYMNMKLENVPVNNKFLKPDYRGYPLSSLSAGCVKFFNSVIRDCSAPVLEHLLYFSIQTMLEEDQKGAATYGYKIFLQLLAKTKADIVLSKLRQYKEIEKTASTRPMNALLVLWAVGQVGLTDLRRGVRVWLDVMLPCLGMHSIETYCVEYLEALLSAHSKKLKAANGEIKLREYFHLLDLVYGTGLQKDLRKRMLDLYPKLKVMAFTEDLNNNLRNFFPSFLVRATQDCPQALKTEVLSCLQLCLTKDKQSYGLWCQYYTKHLAQSSVLLQHLLKNWDTVSGQLDKKVFRQTVQSFVRTNEEMSQTRSAGDWEGSTAVCEELLKKMSGTSFPWRWLMFFFVSMVTGVMVYDVYTSQSLRASRTISFLESYGILAVLEQGWSKLCVYTDIVYSWLHTNVPPYYNQVYNTCSPYLQQVVAYLQHFEEITREQRADIREWIYQLYPAVWDELSKYLEISLEFLAVLWKDIYHWVDEQLVKNHQ